MEGFVSKQLVNMFVLRCSLQRASNIIYEMLYILCLQEQFLFLSGCC